MKNKIKLVGIIAIAVIIGFSMAGCKKGGTLEIENRTNGTITAFAKEGTAAQLSDPVAALAWAFSAASSMKSINKNQTASWTFSDDCEVIFIWDSDIDSDKGDAGVRTIEKKKTVKITAQ